MNKTFYSDLVTRCARLYFRESRHQRLSTLERMGVDAVRKVVERTEPEKVEILKKIYTPITVRLGINDQVILIQTELGIRGIWQIVDSFEKAVAKELELI